MPINEISDELGFNETGYFIKIFKKYEGVTPFVYRKYCKKIKEYPLYIVSKKI